MDGTLDRIVALVAVRVEREADTRILAEACAIVQGLVECEALVLLCLSSLRLVLSLEQNVLEGNFHIRHTTGLKHEESVHNLGSASAELSEHGWMVLPSYFGVRLLKTDLKFIASGLLTVQSETQVEVKETQASLA
eukprot:3772433-Amphidinium_carterae.1